MVRSGRLLGTSPINLQQWYVWQNAFCYECWYAHYKMNWIMKAIVLWHEDIWVDMGWSDHSSNTRPITFVEINYFVYLLLINTVHICLWGSRWACGWNNTIKQLDNKSNSYYLNVICLSWYIHSLIYWHS